VGKWNPNGKGFQKIEDDSFLRLKLREFWRNIGISFMAAVVLQSAQLHLWNGRDLLDPDDLTNMSGALGAGIGFTVVITHALKLLRRNRSCNEKVE